MALPDAGDKDLRNALRDLDDLTPVEKAMMFGTLLGDGHMRENAGRVRLKIEHATRYSGFVKWKYQKLKRLCPTTSPPYRATDAKTFLFSTSETPKYCFVHRLFYKAKWDSKKNKVRYVKMITQELLDSLPVDPLLLAVWFMDDATARNDAYSGKLYTMGFGPDGTQLLRDYIQDAYGLDTNVIWNNRAKNQKCLSITAKVFPKFIDLIRPHVLEVPELTYKLNEVRRAQSKYTKN